MALTLKTRWRELDASTDRVCWMLAKGIWFQFSLNSIEQGGANTHYALEDTL